MAYKLRYYLVVHLKESFLLGRTEPVAFLDPWVPLQERPCGYPPCDPLNGNHVTLVANESGIITSPHKMGFYTLKNDKNF